MQQYGFRQLNELGFSTPQPVAAIDIFHRGTIRQSYYISQASDYQPIVFDMAATQQLVLMDEITDLLLRLHDQGVMYNDLNLANILYKRGKDGNYDFQFVDTNRISFHKSLTLNQRIKDLRRLSCQTTPYSYILSRYAEKVGFDTDEFSSLGLLSRITLAKFNNLKHRKKGKYYL